MSIQRWGMYSEECADHPGPEPDGEFVKYSDHLEAMQAICEPHSFILDGRRGFGVGDPLRSCEICGLDESETF